MRSVFSEADLQKHINSMPVYDIVKLLNNYQKTTGIDMTCEKEKLIFDDLQQRLLECGINSLCPGCSSNNIVKFGFNGKVRRFKCKDCGKTFTLFTGTILEKTKYGWDVWVKMVEMFLNRLSMQHMLDVLVNDYGLDGLDIKTVFMWEHKIVHAMANMPTPKLKGVIQADETFFRESQKGSRCLVSPLKGVERRPRYGRIPSKLGTMGNEFANVVAAVDQYGYCIAELACMGKVSSERLYDILNDHTENATFICSDANHIYNDYCSMMDISHYVIPSTYLNTLASNGYVFSAINKKDKQKNQRIMRSLYEKREIDYIDDFNANYADFRKMKNANSLSLGRINQFHRELKEYIVQNTRGVSTKYLSDYIRAWVFVRNWKVSNGREPAGITDAESILIDLLKGKVTYTAKDVQNAKLTIPKANGQYITNLRSKTFKMRDLSGNKYCKFNEEDNFTNFNKRQYLERMPEYQLRKLYSKHKLPTAWTKWSKLNALEKKETLWDDILTILYDGKAKKIEDEDMLAIKSEKYRK